MSQRGIDFFASREAHPSMENVVLLGLDFAMNGRGYICRNVRLYCIVAVIVTVRWRHFDLSPDPRVEDVFHLAG